MNVGVDIVYDIVCIAYCQRAKLGCVLEKGSKEYNLAL